MRCKNISIHPEIVTNLLRHRVRPIYEISGDTKTPLTNTLIRMKLSRELIIWIRDIFIHIGNSIYVRLDGLIPQLVLSNHTGIPFNPIQ